MPRPALRTTSLRRVRKKTPSGVSVVHYYRKRPAGGRCGICGKPLHGVPRDIPSKVRKIPKTKKRPERPYGGTLCSSCTREMVKIKAL